MALEYGAGSGRRRVDDLGAHWYNEVHYHSGIGYLRPADLHAGTHTVIVEHRQAALDAAYAGHPERFTARPRPAKIPTKAWINRPSIQTA